MWCFMSFVSLLKKYFSYLSFFLNENLSVGFYHLKPHSNANSHTYLNQYRYLRKCLCDCRQQSGQHVRLTQKRLIEKFFKERFVKLVKMNEKQGLNYGILTDRINNTI